MIPALRVPAPIANLGAVSGESDADRARRVAFVVLLLVGAGFSGLFAALAASLGDPVTAAADLGGTVVLGSLLAWFARTRRLEPFVISVALVLVALPCAIVVATGDVTGSGGLFVGALGPILAAMFTSRRAALMVLGLHVVATFATVLAFASREPLVSATPEIVLGIAQSINGTIVAGFLVLIITHLVKERRDAMAALEAEHLRSEQLLLNVLPASIAARLKDAPGGIADHFDEATILFADVVGFTPLAAKLPPVALVALLDDLFGRFDALAERHGLEKIKTIGDAYLVVGGLPTPRADHADAVAAMALDLIVAVRAFREESGFDVDVRVGINSGAVVGGVIGRKKFTYDLWGDAVNVASRMESHGLPGRVHVGPGAHALLRERFVLESRGTTAIKGKGDMPTWWLVARAA